MIRVLLTFFLALIPAIAGAQSCGTEDLIETLSTEDRARLDALVAPHPYPRGNLWRAEKTGSTVTVVGTIHIPDPRLTAIVAAVRPAMDAADLLILEASSDDEQSMQTFAATNPDLFFLNQGPTLIDLLKPDEWDLIANRLSKMGIPAFFAAKFQPWYLTMTLAIPPCAITAMQSGKKGLDRQLEVIALETGTPLATLDDVEALLRLFAEEPLERQLDGLRITLETQIDSDATTSTLIESYFDGRVRESWEFGRILVESAGIENGAEMFEDLNQDLLVGRNKALEPKIAQLVAGKNVVLAVGAAHLSGESGILRTLERAGYTLSPIQ